MPKKPATRVKNAWTSPGLGAALIILLTVMAYLPAMGNGFIWDDDDHLTNNPSVLSDDGWVEIWSSLEASRYYPLTQTSFWVQHHLWGLRPRPYHVVNIALHAANAALLWVVLRRLKVPGAWVAAAVWAVHPVNVETVAWVTELKNTQSGFFFLLALWLFLQFEDESHPQDYMLAFLCGVAAMLSKPSTVVLPGVILCCAWWRRRRWTSIDLLRVAPLALAGFGMSVLTIVEQRHHVAGEITSDWTLSVMQRVVLAGRAVWFYAGKVVWPADFCFIYPRWDLQVHSVVGWLPLAGLGFLATALWLFRRERWAQAAAFGIGCFITCLLPVLGFLNIYFFRYSFVADHFQYLASMGLVALVVGAGTMISQRAGERGRLLGVIVSAIMLLSLGLSTWAQSHYYHDDETLWRATLSENPDCWLAHTNLGRDLSQNGHLPEAIAHWEQALRVKPDFSEAHYDLGVALARSDKLPEAIAHWEQALRTEPEYPELHYNLGVALARLGRTREAVEHFQHVLRIDPNFAEAHYQLGMALEKVNNFREAAHQYEEALRTKPDLVDAQQRLARLRSAP